MIDRILVALLSATSERDLIFGGEQLVAAHFLEVLVERGLLLGGARKLVILLATALLPAIQCGSHDRSVQKSHPICFKCFKPVHPRKQDASFLPANGPVPSCDLPHL